MKQFHLFHYCTACFLSCWNKQWLRQSSTLTLESWALSSYKLRPHFNCNDDKHKQLALWGYWRRCGWRWGCFLPGAVHLRNMCCHLPVKKTYHPVNLWFEISVGEWFQIFSQRFFFIRFFSSNCFISKGAIKVGSLSYFYYHSPKNRCTLEKRVTKL